MSVVVNSFRPVIAEAFVENFSPDIFVAIGSGQAIWDSTQTHTGAFAAAPTNTLDVGATPITDVVVQTTDEVTTYVEGQDYSFDGATGIITRIGAGAIPDGGTVKVTYNINKTPLLTQTALENELGRKRASVIGYVEPDVSGDISVPSGNYSISVTPTKYLLIKASFIETEAANETIREFGIFVNTTLDGGLPGGQVYFEPADVSDIGDAVLFHNNDVPINKGVASVVNEQWVISL